MKAMPAKPGNKAPGNYHSFNGDTVKKAYWTDKRIIFLFMIFYIAAVGTVLPVIIAKLFF